MRRIATTLIASTCLAAIVACGGNGSTTTPSASLTATTSPTAHPPCGSETPAAAYDNAPAITFGASSQALRVEIADTPSKRQFGLMNRACLGDDWGMIFVFQGDVNDTFWMKNTLVPLTVAFVKADGTIVGLEDMQPQTENLHGSPEPYRWAIEANQGWFSHYGIQIGELASIPPL